MKLGFAIMAVVNLHIHENIGMDTIFVTVSCLLSTILNKFDFSIMEALIWI